MTLTNSSRALFSCKQSPSLFQEVQIRPRRRGLVRSVDSYSVTHEEEMINFPGVNLPGSFHVAGPTKEAHESLPGFGMTEIMASVRDGGVLLP